MRAYVQIGLICWLLGCGLGWAQSPERSTDVLSETAQLVSDPKLAQLVDALAQLRTVSLTRAGSDDDGGKLQRLLSQLEAASTPAQRATLLHHKSAVVRGYALRYWLTMRDEAQDSISSLLNDDSEIITLINCKSRAVLMCAFAYQQLAGLSALDASPVPVSIQARLVWVAQHGRSRCQLPALRALATLRHPAVAELALPLLDRTEPSLQLTGLELLSRVPRPQHAARVRALTTSTLPTLRARAAAALHAFASPESEGLLRTLMEHDPSPEVRALAAQSYAQQTQRDVQWLSSWRQAARPAQRLRVELGLAYDARPDSLALLQSLLTPKLLVSSDFWTDSQDIGFVGNEVGAQFVDFLKNLRKKQISTELAKKIDAWFAQRQWRLREPLHSVTALDRVLAGP